MSVSGRKRVSKWDSKEEDLSGNDYPEQRQQHARFYPEGKGRNGSSKRSAPDVDDDEHLKSKQQHPGVAWPPRSSRGGDAAAMMGYYDSRKSSSEQDESRDRPRARRLVSLLSSLLSIYKIYFLIDFIGVEVEVTAGAGAQCRE